MLGFRSFEVEGIPARAIVPRRNNPHYLGSNKRAVSHKGSVSKPLQALRSTSGLPGVTWVTPARSGPRRAPWRGGAVLQRNVLASVTESARLDVRLGCALRWGQMAQGANHVRRAAYLRRLPAVWRANFQDARMAQRK